MFRKDDSAGDDMGNLIGFALLVAAPLFGLSGASWSWVFLFAVIGFFGYWLMRPLLLSRAEQESIARGSFGPIAATIAVTYMTQLATWGLLFLAGRGVGLLFSA